MKMAGLPSANSLHSLYNCLHAPWVLAQLARIQARVGKGTHCNIPSNSLQFFNEFSLVFAGSRQDFDTKITIMAINTCYLDKLEGLIGSPRL